MKKIILICCILLVLSGCGKVDEDKEKMFYDSLEKAYITIYSSDGVGLPVYSDEKTEINGKTWYLVASSKYNSLSTLVEYAESVYTEEVYDDIEKVISSKYKEISGELYTTSSGGCLLDYELTDELSNELKKNFKVKSTSGNKVVFSYNNKEYTAKKKDNYYVFSEKIFECPKED